MAVIHWFRCDLRLHDNPALIAAARHGTGAVLPIFILDDALLLRNRLRMLMAARRFAAGMCIANGSHLQANRPVHTVV